jgi:hypothetical protein
VRIHACTICSNNKEAIIFIGSSQEGNRLTKTFEIIRKHDSLNSILDFNESKSPNSNWEDLDPLA